MVKYQKYMFDNFVIACDEENSIDENIEVPSDDEKTDTSVVEYEVTNDKDDVVELDVLTYEDVKVNQDETSFEESEQKLYNDIPSYNQDELDTAVGAAELKGYERGKNEAMSSLEKTQQEILQQMLLSLQELVNEQKHLSQEVETSAMQIAIQAINKILPTLEHDVAKKEVEAFLSGNFGNFCKETNLSFSFHPDMAIQIAPLLSKLADKNDFEGKISVHKDINLGLSDCRVEWKNGGVERSSGKIIDKIKGLISK